MRRVCLAAAAVTILVAGPARADLVQVDVVGEVDFGNLNFGIWQDVSPGDSAVMSFQVDSDVFLDSVNFPTRGYDIIPSSFTLALDGIAAGMPDPLPPGESAYFVLRDNDPAVDGFFLASHPDAFPNGVPTDEPAQINDTFNAIFSATYGGDTLDSLDILDAVGTYTFDGLSVFNWGLEDGPFQPMGFIFDHFTISVVPAPMTLAVFAPLALFGTRRRRA